jgi:hypothetical protein
MQAARKHSFRLRYPLARRTILTNRNTRRAGSYGPHILEKAMRKLLFSTILGLGLLGFAMPTQAKASWLSEGIDHTQVQVNLGASFGPGYAPVQAYYPAYRPAPVYAPPAYGAYRYPSYAPAFRPAPVFQPQRSFYGPSRYEPRRDWHDGRGEWRR